MRARATIGGAIASAAVLLLGWQLGQSAAGSSPGSASASGAGSGTTTGALTDGTFTGSAAQTRYGPMQVEVTVSGGTITAVTVVQATDREGRSAQISAEADPILTSEVLKAQSADVQMVSGATYTSEGYLQSLQSALDQAGA